MRRSYFGLPEEFADLSKARQEHIYRVCSTERHDAAIISVVIGINAINQVHGIGFDRAHRLSESWGAAITAWYKNNRSAVFPGFDPDTAEYAGEPVTDLAAEFPDLSARRIRQLHDFYIWQRREAQWTADSIGIDVIRREFRYGPQRMAQLLTQWSYDIRDFWQDRDVRQEQLQDMVERMGFCFDNGRLQSYRTEDGTVLKKQRAEKLMEAEPC